MTTWLRQQEFNIYSNCLSKKILIRSLLSPYKGSTTKEEFYLIDIAYIPCVAELWKLCGSSDNQKWVRIGEFFWFSYGSELGFLKIK